MLNDVKDDVHLYAVLKQNTMIVEVCGRKTKCFTDVGDDIIISPFSPVSTSRAVDLLIDNGVFHYLRQCRSIDFDSISRQYVKFVVNVTTRFRPRIVRLIIPDYPYNWSTNIVWADKFISKFYNVLYAKLKELKVERVITYIVCHGFDMALWECIDFARDHGIFVALPCRNITFTFGVVNSRNVKHYHVAMIRDVINKTTTALGHAHLLGPSKILIRKIGCEIEWSKVTFDTLAYRISQGRFATGDAMVKTNDPDELKRAFEKWWSGAARASCGRQRSILEYMKNKQCNESEGG